MSLALAAHDDDRARRVVHAVLPDRAQHCLGQPAVTAAAHHEQVRSFGRLFIEPSLAEQEREQEQPGPGS